MKSVEERFWSKVDKSGDCWLWTAYKNRKGYGTFNVRGKMMLSHRYSWELRFGAIPEGMCVCHHCDNPPCVNPRHLFIGSNKDNQRDSVLKGRNADKTGELNGRAKLTWSEVERIRFNVACGVLHREEAERLGVYVTTISKIVRYINWKGK